MLENKQEKLEKIENTVQQIRAKYGFNGIQRGILLQEEHIGNIQAERLIAPAKIEGEIVDEDIKDIKTSDLKEDGE